MRCLSILLTPILSFIPMTPSQQKKLNQYLYEQLLDDSHSFVIEKSLHLNSRTRNQQRNYHNRDINYNKNISRKYEQPGKQSFLSILDPSPKIQPREDFNIRNQPPPAPKQDPPPVKKNGPWPRCGRKGESPRKSVEELNIEIEEYRRKGERIGRSHPNHKNSSNPSGEKILQCVDLSNIEEKDLSFAELKPEYNFKKDRNTQKSNDFKQKTKEEKADEGQDQLTQLNKSPEGQQTSKRQNRHFNSELQKVQKNTKQEDKQDIECRGRKKNQQKQSQVLQKSPIVSFEQNSNTKTINRAFNNLSQDSSSNNSSNWVEEKILQSLDHSISNESDSISNNTESFISNIHENAIAYSDPFPSAPSKPVLSPVEEKARVDKILKQIFTSKDFQIKEMNLQVKELKNIMEVTVKEVSVDRLGTNLKLALGEDGIMVKRSEVEVEKLRQYISFYQIRVAYPRIFYSESLSSVFPFCRLRVPPVEREEQPQERGFIKKGKRSKQQDEGIKAEELLRVVLVELKCMNCEKASDVPVIKNQAYLSCRNCNEQMIANIQPTFSS